MKKADARRQTWEPAGFAAAVLLGAVWAVIPSLFLSAPSAESRLLVISLVFAAVGVGSLALAGSPRSATVFCAMLTGVATVMAVQMETLVGYMLAGFAVAYGGTILAIGRLGQHIVSFSVQVEREATRKDAIIALALNDQAGMGRNWCFETDAEGLITFASPGLSGIAGSTPEDLKGQPFSSLFDAETGGVGWSRLQLAIATRQGIECAVEVISGQHRLWWHVACHPVTGADGIYAGHRGMAHNITPERQARRRLVEQNELSLRESEAKSQFLQDIVQELRPPLSTILGFAEFLASPAARAMTETERRTHHQTLLESSRSVSDFVSELGDMVRLDRGRLHLTEQEVDAAELAEIAMKRCRGLAEAADVVILASVFDDVELRCDAARIEQVLAGLVTRALRASQAGGFVRVGFARTADGGLSLSIHDEGPALTSQQMDRIFEPSLLEDGLAGLCLPIARRIAMLHGGDVTIDSCLGVGTTARLILPGSRVSWMSGEHTGSTRAA